ncbi:MAG: response regulator [Candidatus Brocadiae bacterium]|nr:response regulator [Candidatus Brocadiia bacterium]
MNTRQIAQKILIADDHAIHLAFVKELIEQMGFDVITTTDGKKMLDQAKLNPPDLILMDIFMPGMDGYTALTHLRGISKLAKIPVILMSAHSDVQSHHYILSAFEKVDFLPKPIEIEILQEKLTKMGCNPRKL